LITVSYLGSMKCLTIFLVLSCLYSTSNAQTAADTAAIQIRQLLKPGKHLVHYIRPDLGKQLTPEETALLAKVQKALADNGDWLSDTTKKISGNTEDVTDSVRIRLGLTKEEWKTFKDMADPAKKSYQIYGEDTIEIISGGDQLHFRGTGSAAKLDSVRIDLTGNRVLFKDKQIPFSRVHQSTGEDNGLHSPAVTYEYELENSSMSDSTNVKTLRMERYEFGVARLPLAGKTMIMFMTMNMQGGNFSTQPAIMLIAFLE
jgi:hypothetical protein